MSKKIALSIPVTVTVLDRDLALLDLVDRLCADSGVPAPGRVRGSRDVVSASVAKLADASGTSLSTCRRAIASVRDAGYLEVNERYLENGGRMESLYGLTERGRAVVRAARQAGVLMCAGERG